MSFILEQLKKSGKKRKLEMAMCNKTDGAGTENGPELQQGTPASLPAEAAGSRMSWVVLSVVLAAAAFSAGFMYLRRDSGRLNTVSPVPAVVQSRSQSVEAPKQVPAPPAELPKKSAPAVQLPRAVPAKSVSAGKPPVREKTAIVRHDPADRPVAAEKKIVEKEADKKEKLPVAALRPVQTGVEPSGTVMDIRHLPPSVKKALPEIRITSHLYKKESPLVSINGRIMSAGVNLDNGLYLEEITPDGVIMVFRNHRFRVTAE